MWKGPLPFFTYKLGFLLLSFKNSNPGYVISYCGDSCWRVCLESWLWVFWFGVFLSLFLAEIKFILLLTSLGGGAAMILYLFILCYSIYDSSFKKHISEYRWVLLVDAHRPYVPSTIFVVYCCLKWRHLEIFFPPSSSSAVKIAQRREII